MTRIRSCLRRAGIRDLAAFCGGMLTGALFPHEPGWTFLPYGGVGGLIGSWVAMGIVTILYRWREGSCDA